MNNQQDDAKNQLFQFEEFEGAPIYDPYRTKNILKDSNRNNEQTSMNKQNKSKKSGNNHKYFQYGQNVNNQEEPNYRRSLKKLLERLQSIPSPDKKVSKFYEQPKALELISYTEPLVKNQLNKKPRPNSHKTKTSLQSRKKNNGLKNSILAEISCQSQLRINSRPLKTMTSSAGGVMSIPSRPLMSSAECLTTPSSAQNSRVNRTTSSMSKQHLVRQLIKQKLAEKMQNSKQSIYRKGKFSSNLLNFLRENNSAQLQKRKKYKKVWQNPRKLTNLLLIDNS